MWGYSVGVRLGALGMAGMWGGAGYGSKLVWGGYSGVAQ
jgi:hypothetical protein